MEQHKGRIIKRHALRKYEYWRYERRFLAIDADQISELEKIGTELPATNSGYLLYAYLDDVMRVAFVGKFNSDNATYEFFTDKKLVVFPATMLDNIQVRLLKPTVQLMENPYVQQVENNFSENILQAAAHTLRGLDPFRDPLYPGVINAFYVGNKEQLSKYLSSFRKYREELTAYEQAFAEWRQSVTQADEKPFAEEPQKPNMRKGLVKRIKIKDLTPANNKTWNAVLVEALGRDKAKAGTKVQVRLVTLEQEEKQPVILPFIIADAKPQGEKVQVALQKTTRLPWRKAYELKCPECDFSHIYYLGRNGDDPELFRRIMEDLRKGKLDPAFYIELVQQSDSELDFSRELYRCRACGELKVTRRLRIVTPETSLSEAYICSECGERMSHVKRVHIASLNCPCCKAPLSLVNEKVWFEADVDEV